MTQTPAVDTQRQKMAIKPLAARFAPAVLAIGLAWCGHSAQAAPLDGQNAINTKLTAFITDFSTDPEPNAVLGKIPTNVTAKAADLLLAVAAVLEDPLNTVSVEDVVAGAIRQDTSGKARADRDKVIASLIDQAIKSENLAGDTATIALILQTVLDTNFTDTKLGLTSAGRAAAIGQALKSATDPLAGDTIAEQQRVKDHFTSIIKVADKQKFAATAILNASTGTGANAGAVASFVDGLFDDSSLNGLSPSDRIGNAIAIGKLVKKSNAAVGAAIDGALIDRTDIPSIQTGAISALAKTQGLQAAASNIAAAAAQRVQAIGDSNDVAALATALGSDTAVAADNKVKGGIVSGALQAVLDGENAIITSIYNGLKPIKVTDEITYASLAAVGNNDFKVGAITGLAAGATGIDKTKLGGAIVAAISLTNPDAADAVGAVLGASSTDRPTLAANLAKAAKSSTAAGKAAAGVAGTAATDGDRTTIAIAANKAASKFISSISMEIGAHFVDVGNSTRLTTFAANLTNANTAKASDIATGASLANPIYADQVVDKVVFLTGANTGKVKGSVAKVVQAVGTAVDVEEVAEIVTQVATHFTIDGKAAGTVNLDNALKVSNAAAIATAAAKAIQLKPGVKTANRQDELGESAASIVGQILNGYKNGNLVFKPATAVVDLAKQISAVTASIIKVLSKKELVDTLTQQADLSAAANIAADVANTLFQATQAGGGLLITAGELDTIKTQLFKDIPKLGGKGYADYKVGTTLTDGLITIAMKAGFLGDNTRFESGVRSALTDVSQDPGITPYVTNPSTLAPGTKTGSVIDPETDSRPG